LYDKRRTHKNWPLMNADKRGFPKRKVTQGGVWAETTLHSFHGTARADTSLIRVYPRSSAANNKCA
jgi:hypothetical protein